MMMLQLVPSRVLGCTQHTSTSLKQHRNLTTLCQASKTTSSRSKTTSSRSKTTSSRSSTTSSRDGTASTKQYDSSRKQDNANRKIPLQERLDSLQQRVGNYLSFLVPKQEGDIGDVLMMSLSMAVLIYLSMQLYRLYAYAYFHAGQYQTLMDMMQ